MADIVAKVRRSWDNGSLLRTYATGSTFDGIEVPIRGPSASRIGDDLGAVRTWVRHLDSGRRDDSHYTLVWRSVGGRQIGRNDLPARAVVSSLEQAWSLLGVREAVRRYDQILATAEPEPAVRQWAIAHPLQALEHSEAFSGLVAAYRWLDDHRGSALYSRVISAPGVDTKFAERYRAILAAMLEVPATASGFLSGLGLRAKPEYVRLRAAPGVGVPLPLTEVTLRVSELAAVPLRPRRALVIENEITYLSVDVPTDGLVIWGKGFEVDRIGRLPWLADAEVTYWGDIDTHGFAILDRLRRGLPDARSVLMDRATLVEHRDRWVVEEKPTRVALPRLTRSEHDLYEELVTDVHGDRVRLEQERIDWEWALSHIG